MVVRGKVVYKVVIESSVFYLEGFLSDLNVWSPAQMDWIREEKGIVTAKHVTRSVIF